MNTKQIMRHIISNADGFVPHLLLRSIFQYHFTLMHPHPSSTLWLSAYKRVINSTLTELIVCFYPLGVATNRVAS